MGFWAWFFIWVALVIAGLIVLFLIGRSLALKIKGLTRQVERLDAKLRALSQLTQNKPNLPKSESNIFDNPADLVAQREQIHKTREKRQKLRERRLVAAIRDFDPEESRFNK